MHGIQLFNPLCGTVTALDRNLKNSKDLTKLELFDFQVFQILPVLEHE